MVAPDASSPKAGPVAALPAGTLQVKVGMAKPTPEMTLATEHNGAALQVALPAASVSHTKRTRRPAGGAMASLMSTPVPKDGPALVTATR